MQNAEGGGQRAFKQPRRRLVTLPPLRSLSCSGGELTASDIDRTIPLQAPPVLPPVLTQPVEQRLRRLETVGPQHHGHPCRQPSQLPRKPEVCFPSLPRPEQRQSPLPRPHTAHPPRQALPEVRWVQAQPPRLSLGCGLIPAWQTAPSPHGSRSAAGQAAGATTAHACPGVRPPGAAGSKATRYSRCALPTSPPPPRAACVGGFCAVPVAPLAARGSLLRPASPPTP
jgi:hypothetical protein